MPGPQNPRFGPLRSDFSDSWDSAHARGLTGGGLPASPFRLRGGFTIPPCAGGRPFRLVGIAVGGALELVGAVIFLPARMLKAI